MFKIPLTSIPNQSISFNMDGAYWEVHVFQAIERMYIDITRNSQVVIQGSRCLGGIPLMPYRYMYAPLFGNFIFDSDADWTKFGNSCNLFYLTADEFTEYSKLANF